MLSEFIAWWVQHLLELLPWHVASTDESARDALIIEPVAAESGGVAGVRAFVRHQRRLEPLGQFAHEASLFTLDANGLQALREVASEPARRNTVRLRLPAGTLLEKNMMLPLAVEAELEHVVLNEMDRETPFSGDDVFWAYAIQSRDKAAGQLVLRLSLVPRMQFGDTIARLETVGIGPDSIEAIASDGTTRLLHLDAASARSHHRRHWETRVLGGACAVLALLHVGLPFLHQSFAMARLNTQIAKLKPDADEAQTLRRQIIDSRAGTQVIAAERQRLGDPLQILAETTKVLPDNTHLTEFSMSRRHVSMAGRSSSAAELIGALSGDPMFRNPSFSAPVTRLEGSPLDLFTIGSDVVQAP